MFVVVFINYTGGQVWWVIDVIVFHGLSLNTSMLVALFSCGKSSLHAMVVFFNILQSLLFSLYLWEKISLIVKCS
jgi:hypothetical protein